jgi:hypothetical protein
MIVKETIDMPVRLQVSQVIDRPLPGVFQFYPIVFISRNRVKEGLFEAFRKHYRDFVPAIEAGKPDTLLQLA